MKLLFIVLFALVTTGAFAQEEAAVENVIKTMFEGMYEGDSAKVHSVFAKNITMATVFRDKTGNPQIRHEASLNSFLKAVGTPHGEKWTEEFWNVVVRIDDDLAQAWCDYAFYVDHTFSHCGVDAFHLHKTKEGWKIFQLADTRRKDNCNIPEAIVNKHQ